MDNIVHIDIRPLTSIIIDKLNYIEKHLGVDFLPVEISNVVYSKYTNKYLSINKKEIDEKYFFVDVLIEKMFFDVLGSKMLWCGCVVENESFDYIIDNLLSNPTSITKALLKNQMQASQLFAKEFLSEVESILLNIPGGDHIENTWDQYSVSYNHSCVTIENLGDWRIVEYMRLLESGTLDEEYLKDKSVPINSFKIAELTKKKESFSDKADKENFITRKQKYDFLIETIENKIKADDVDYLLEAGLIKKKGRRNEYIVIEDAVIDMSERDICTASKSTITIKNPDYKPLFSMGGVLKSTINKALDNAKVEDLMLKNELKKQRNEDDALSNSEQPPWDQ